MNDESSKTELAEAMEAFGIQIEQCGNPIHYGLLVVKIVISDELTCCDGCDVVINYGMPNESISYESFRK